MPIKLEQIKDRLLGNQFGKLTVEAYLGRNNTGDNLWKAKCKCGNEVIVVTYQVSKPNSACTICKFSVTPTVLNRQSELLGKISGRLTVVSFAGKTKFGASMWKCLCSCGNEATVRGDALRTEKAKSCGCYQKEISAKAKFIHGLHRHRLYGIWTAMKSRCYIPTCPAYGRYGYRGISICDEWRNDFLAFYNWSMANGYVKGLSIDRINNDGNYEPNNCRYVTSDIQAQNQSRTKITIDLVPIIRADKRIHSVIAEEYGVDESTISRIINRQTWKNIL